MKNLEGKTAIVTGAGSGIGAATAAEFVALGMNVVLADIQADKLDEVRATLAARGGSVIGIVTDVSDAESVERLAEAARDAFGKVHVAFNNAGVAMHGTPMVDMSMADWNWVIDVNIKGMIHCIRSFTPMLVEHGQEAHIVNTASIGGLQVNPAWLTGAYSMTKFAAVALSEALRNELTGTAVSVSVLCPGAVATSLASSVSRPQRFGGATERPQQEFLRNALVSGATPEQVARRVVEGIRDEAFYIFTDTVAQASITARHRAIEAAFDRCAEEKRRNTSTSTRGDDQ